MGFEGGEPLLRRDLPQILEESHRRFHTSLVTNGWLLKDRIREIRDYLDYLFVSIDGLEETHDKIRGVPGAFRHAIDGVIEARKYVPVALSTTITRDNLWEIEDIVRLAMKLGISVTVQVAYDYSTAESLSPDKESLRIILERLIELKARGAPIIESMEYFRAILNSWYGGKPWRCKPWLLINIDPRGRIVLPCYVLTEYKGDLPVWDVDIRRIWREFPWSKYENCNKCALSCYLEPSLFTLRNPSMVNERIISNILSYLRSTVVGRLGF